MSYVTQAELTAGQEDLIDTLSPQQVRKANSARIPSVPLEDTPNVGIQSARVILKLCLYRTEVGLSAPTRVSDDHQELVTKQVCYVQKYAQQDWLVRKWLGGSFDVWQDYQTCIDDALISVIPRMFLAPPGEEIPYQSATAFMCSHAPLLIRDLERLNDLLLVARTLLVLNPTAQAFIVRSGTDQRLLRLFEISLRVCARSNDSDPSENTEQVCSTIVSTCKSLLGTIMSLLNSITTSNPPRMLCLWVDLFMRNTSEHLGLEADLEIQVFGDQARTNFAAQLEARSTQTSYLPTVYELDRAMLALGNCHRLDRDSLEDLERRRQAIRQVHLGLQPEARRNSEAEGQNDTTSQPNPDPAAKVMDWPPYARGFPQAIDDLFKWIRAGVRHAVQPRPCSERATAHEVAKRVLVEDLQMTAPKPEDASEGDSRNQANVNATVASINNESPHYIEETSASHTRIDSQESMSHSSTQDQQSALPQSNHNVDEDDDYSDEEDDDLDDDDERDPYGEAFRRRGIISELPLVLSPNDIMPLCVILQNAVWLDGFLPKHDVLTRLFKALQCHILVTQETGKNLLREVLIFVAAWDLTEGDLAYVLIAEVMEAVLYHGLMPIAWFNYRESKDVVSPAQSIIVKVLGLIFRQRRKDETLQKNPSDNVALDALPDEFVFDREIIETLLEDFRSVVVPQTVALIWLQGQIRRKACLAEDFPLNFWEMERVYEGVYQFLELFAILTETAAWKELFVRHELTFELIALLRELENCIPKVQVKLPSIERPLTSPAPPHVLSPVSAQRPSSQQQYTNTVGGTPGSVPVAVERPYETSPSPPRADPISSLSPDAHLFPGQETLEEAEEASEFTWRNLKKLVVLVLGSLAYKNPAVRTQVREMGGVELIMKCFEYDEHNQFIREHAVLCLNFLLERSPENQAVAMDVGTVRNVSVSV